MHTAEAANPNEVLPSFLQRHAALLLPLALTLLLVALGFLTPARENPVLVRSFCGAGAVLLAWQLILLRQAARAGRRLTFEFVPVKAHYIQATLHTSIFLYWGFYWRPVYEHAHLILAQVVFLYAFDMLLCWSRRDRWRLGFGPLPIVFSTNLFLLFRPDWFMFQFLMLATGALGKEFIKWTREGRRTHIFNPSGLSLSVFSLGLILTGTTHHTWGEEIATTLNAPPHIYLWIFALGLIVQYFFAVTLMTLSAAAVLWIFNLIYTQWTGVYFFIDSNIPIAVFLGLHLLVTDPSTSPRSNVGRVIFGALYGLAVAVLYALLERWGSPQFYDKLLCVPLLNLCVIMIDRFSRVGVMGKISAWSDAIDKRRLNLLNMAVWIALFGVMLGTGFVGGNHKGGTLEFWQKASDQGKRHADNKLFRMLDYQAASGSADACNRLGIAFMEGKITEQNPDAAAELFNRGSELGSMGAGCNLVNLYVHYGVGTHDHVSRAVDRLEAAPADHEAAGKNAFFVALAYASGRGRPLDKGKALEFFRKSSEAGWVEGSIRFAAMRIQGDGVPVDLAEAAAALERGTAAGSPICMFHLAGLLYQGQGVPRDEARAIELLQRAREAGLPEAGAMLQSLGR